MSDLYKQNFNDEQLIMIDQGRDLGLSAEQEQVYAKPEFSWEQMYELQQGFLDNLTISHVASYADPSLSPKNMEQKRKDILKSLGLEMANDSLLKDTSVQNVMNVLKGNGMEREANNFFAVISQIEILSGLVRKQEKDINQLENQVKDLYKPNIRERAAEIVESAKKDLNDLKEKVTALKETIKEGSKFLYETFKSFGKLAFCKAFEKFASGLKETFQFMKNNNRRNFENNEISIKKIGALQEELKSVKTHLFNAGRVLAGRKTKGVTNDKHISLVLNNIEKFLKYKNKESDKFNAIYDTCIGKLDALEKAFSDLTKEHKQDLNSLISNASSKKKANEPVNVPKKENDMDR